ncbi:MAG: PKD domain-containing protein [Microthrixaceae bacterium]
MLSRSRRLSLLAFSLLAILGMATSCTPEPEGGGNNQRPVAVANAYPGATSMEIAFSSAGSYDPDGSIVGYEWDFGDG